MLTPDLVTFTRSTAALNAAMLPQWQYLHAATFEIADRDGILANAWIDHPQFDPFIGQRIDRFPSRTGVCLSYGSVSQD